MIPPMGRYFLRHALFSRRGAKILSLGLVGLTISSFALLVLQGAMGGLQKNLMGRSQRILGNALFSFHNSVPPGPGVQKILGQAETLGLEVLAEYELELLVKRGERVSGGIVHGVSPGEGRAPFLEGLPLEDILVPYGLASRLGVSREDRILLASPAHRDSFMEDVPRSVSGRISGVFTTGVPEIDEHHLWVRLGLVQNLVAEAHINVLRFWGSETSLGEMESFLGTQNLEGHYRKWESTHPGLVWALELERRVMVALFGAMALLVSLCVTGGMAIFFDRAKDDLACAWVLGASKQAIYRGARVFLFVLSSLATVSGTILGILFLWAFDRWAPEMLPHIFVDRKIPVSLEISHILTSLVLPLGLALLFGHWALGHFGRSLREGHYLGLIRSRGQ